MPQVLNAGIGGHNSQHLLARLDADVLAHQPTVVIMKVGTNDALNSKALIPAADFRANLDLLVQRITAASALLLATPLPFHSGLHGSRHDPAAFGDQPPVVRHRLVLTAIHEVAAARTLPVVDLHAIFTGCGGAHDGVDCLVRNPANSGAHDGVHPTPAGYRVIAAAIHAALRAHRLPDDRVVCFGDSITFGSSVVGAGTCDGETYPACLARMLAAG